jgi:hypothetical protein
MGWRPFLTPVVPFSGQSATHQRTNLVLSNSSLHLNGASSDFVGWIRVRDGFQV